MAHEPEIKSYFFDSTELPGLMHDIPQAPSHKHFFFLLLQSSCDEHFLKHFCPNKVACSSSRGQSDDGEFLGFL